MSLLTTVAFEQISELHLCQFIENATSEARDLDFKLQPPGNANDDKKEFLKDVTSFANTAGGHMVIGMAENAGIAMRLEGLSGRSADDEILRLESILLGSIEPRLFGVRMRAINLKNGGYALVIRVPQSWNPPHRVSFGGVNRYHLRHSNGTYEPSVEQLRAVFLGGADMERRLLEFRLERLARLETGDRGLSLRGRGKLVVQTMPLARDYSAFVISDTQKLINEFQPDGYSLNFRHNLDGFLIYAVEKAGENSTPAYTQIFHDGRLEMASAGLVHTPGGEGDSTPVLASRIVLSRIAQCVRQCLGGASKFGAAFPMAVLVSLLDVGGTQMPRNGYSMFRSERVDRADLLFAPLVIEDGQAESAWDQLMLPVFNALWNAYGYERCFHVTNEDGSWKGMPT